MSCSEPGGRNGDGPLRPFRASNDLAAKFARSLRSIATCKSAGTLPFDDAVALEAALWEVAREGDFDDELAALLDDV